MKLIEGTSKNPIKNVPSMKWKVIMYTDYDVEKFAKANAGFDDQEDYPNEEGKQPENSVRLVAFNAPKDDQSGWRVRDLIFYGTMEDLIRPGVVEKQATDFIYNENLQGFGISDISRPIPVTLEEIEPAKEMNYDPNTLYKVKVRIKSGIV